MTIFSGSRRTLADRLWPGAANAHLRTFLLVLAGTVFLTLSAKIKVPFWPVEMTLQTFAVMLLGAACGWRLGVLTVLAYLAEGALGLPVFAATPEKGIGLAYMMGPSGGYLLGFVAAVAIVGWAAENGATRSPLRLGLAMLLADGVVFALGVLWLGVLFGWTTRIFAWGVLPFIAGDALKIALAALAVPALWRIAGYHDR